MKPFRKRREMERVRDMGTEEERKDKEMKIILSQSFLVVI